MMRDELEYLKYIMRDSFGKESSKVTELILLHGNCLTIGEIITLYQSEFRIIRNVLLTLLIYNILDFHIVYDSKRECVHSNEKTELQENDTIYEKIKKDKSKRTGRIRKMEKIYERDKEKKNKKENEDNVGINNSATSELENGMKNVTPFLENFKYINGCHCEMCVCKIKRVEYSVIISNIYMLIRYPSILYHIHPTIIINKKNPTGIKEYDTNFYTKNNLKNNKNTKTVDPFQRARNFSQLYNFFYVENEENQITEKEDEAYNVYHNIVEQVGRENKRDRREKGQSQAQTQSQSQAQSQDGEEREELFENVNLLSYIEKVIIIRIAKKGRLTINDCIKDFHNDDYIKLCSKEIPNISRKKLKQIFLNLLNKNFIKKCKYFNEHFCKHGKYLYEEHKGKVNLSAATSINTFTIESNKKDIIPNNTISSNNNKNSIFLNQKENQMTTTKNNNMVTERKKKVIRQKVIKKENIIENQTQHNQMEDMCNTKGSSCGRTRKRNVNESKKNDKKKYKVNIYIDEKMNNIEDEKQNEEEHNDMTENIFSLLNMDITENSPKIEKVENKINQTKNVVNNYVNKKCHIKNDISILKNKRIYQIDTYDYLDNPHTYFQVNNYVLSFLYLKQLCFDFVTNLFSFNEVTKCIFFYLMKKVYINNTDFNMSRNHIKHNLNGYNINTHINFDNTIEPTKNIHFSKNNNFEMKTEMDYDIQYNATFVMFDEIESYVCKALRKVKIEVNKNLVLQNLNLLLKNSDNLVKSQRGESIRYAVDFSNVLNLYKSKMLHKIIKKIAGQEGLRVWNFLTFSLETKCNDDKCNDETISEKVLIPVNDVRKTLYNLLNMGFIKCHEWSGGNTTTATNTTDTTNNTTKTNNTINATNSNSSNTTNTKHYAKHALLFSSNLFLTYNKIKEHLYIIAQKIFIRKYFENQEINNLYNKSFISGTDYDNFFNNETNFGVNCNMNEDSRNVRQADNVSNIMHSISNNSNKIKNNKRTSLAALEYAMDYLEISLIKLDRLIFLFNS